MVQEQNVERILVMHLRNLYWTQLAFGDLAQEEQLSSTLCRCPLLASSPTAQGPHAA